MWSIPPFSDLESTLQDPATPIGKRMRAAYYCKQLFHDSEKKSGCEERPQPFEIVRLLCRQLFEKSHGSLLRHEFAYVLGQMQSPLACESLHQLLQSEDDCVMVRHEAAEALGAIASTESLGVLQSVYQQYTGSIDELADTCLLALHKIENPATQVGCACMLAPYSSIDPVEADPHHVGLTASQLGDLLLEPSLDLVERYRAMFSLRNRGGVDCISQLCRALTKDKSSPLLRHEVAFVLGQMQHPASIDALKMVLCRKEEHVMVRHEAAEALGAIEVENSNQWDTIESILTKYQQDSVKAVAESCVVALDAADYWGHAHVARHQQDPLSPQNLDVGSSVEVSNFNAGLLERYDEQSRKQVLANHFNVRV